MASTEAVVFPSFDDKPNKDDCTEHQLGISVYLSPNHEGFSAVMKARYSDFVVHEVAQDGRVARLEKMDATIENGPATKETEAATDEANRKRKREEEEEPANKEKKTETAAEPLWEGLEKDLANIVEPEAAQRVIQFLKEDAVKAKEEKKWEKNDSMFVALPPIPEKDKRRQVHQWIKSSQLHSIATADTAQDSQGNNVIRFWPLRHEKKMPNHGQFDRNGGRRGQRNKKQKVTGYLQFVLYKENCDTNTAVKQITQRMGGGGRGRGRGRGRGGRFNDRVRVGYAGMKDKRGVTSQFMTLHQRSPEEIMWVNNTNSRGGGGGNTSKGGVALVRVGNFRQVDQELRLGRLNGNRFDVVLRNVQTDHADKTSKEVVAQSAEALKQYGFINYFGTQRFGKFQDTHLAGMAFLKGEFETVVQLIMRPKEGERTDVLEARQKWEKRFEKLPKEATKEARAKAEADCARQVLRSMGRFMANEVSVLESLSRHPLDYKRAFSGINKTMRMMFMHAVQSLLFNKVASHRIEKMGLEVLVGDLVFVGGTDPSPDSKSESAVKHVTEEDIAAKKYALEDVVLPLLGTKSVKPSNESGTLFDPLLEEHGLQREMFEKIQDRDVTCPGDYRKLICRPSDVDFSIVEYHDPYQPLLQTDLMKVNGVQVLENASDDDKKPLLGMVVGFTLPSSAYATIALRELMKRPTSSDYQKELGLGGPANATS